MTETPNNVVLFPGCSQPVPEKYEIVFVSAQGRLFASIDDLIRWVRGSHGEALSKQELIYSLVKMSEAGQNQ